MDNSEEKGDVGGHVSWNSAASAFMLKHLAEMVATGTRTSSGFKKVHLNMCARAINDHFKTKYAGDNVKNHLRTWQRRYAKILRLRKLSASGWDEDNCMITLDAEHYAGYVADHKSDAEFFNKPLEHYASMSTIFENSMATGKYAKGSSEPIGVDDTGHVAVEEGDNSVPTTPTGTTNTVATDFEQGASSSATRPNKRAKTCDLDGDPLVAAFTSFFERLATAIEKLAKGDMDLPPDLYTILKSLPGFNSAHISFYYSHLVANPHIGRAFYNLPFDAKIEWDVEFITNKFPGY